LRAEVEHVLAAEAGQVSHRVAEPVADADRCVALPLAGHSDSASGARRALFRATDAFLGAAQHLVGELLCALARDDCWAHRGLKRALDGTPQSVRNGSSLRRPRQRLDAPDRD
jgi:hypothetical protein